MVSLQRIAFMAALLMGIAIAALPSLGWANQPFPALGTLPASTPEALPDLIEQNVLEPVSKHMRAGLEVLDRAEDHAKDWRDLKERIVHKIDRIVPKEGRDSGGVRQLHPLRGTFLIRDDYAQQTLEEDWFLHRDFRTAALHLDVPYDADVVIEYPRVLTKNGNVLTKDDGTPRIEPRLASVRSRGRYRHLKLTDLPSPGRQLVKVWASVWTKDPRCQAGMTTICKKVPLQAGDRRHLAFPKDDFLAMAPPVAAFIAPLSAGQAPKTTPASIPSRIKFDVKKLPFKATDFKTRTEAAALLAYVQYGGPGGTAKSFTFSKASGHTPNEIALVYSAPSSSDKPPTDKFKLKLKLTWQTMDRATNKLEKETSAEFEDPATYQFPSDRTTGEYTVKVPFAGKMAVSETTPGVKVETTKTTTSPSEEKTESITTVQKLPTPADLRGVIEQDFPTHVSYVDRIQVSDVEKTEPFKPWVIRVEGLISFVSETEPESDQDKAKPAAGGAKPDPKTRDGKPEPKSSAGTPKATWIPMDNSFLIIVREQK